MAKGGKDVKRLIYAVCLTTLIIGLVTSAQATPQQMRFGNKYPTVAVADTTHNVTWYKLLLVDTDHLGRHIFYDGDRVVPNSEVVFMTGDDIIGKKLAARDPVYQWWQSQDIGGDAKNIASGIWKVTRFILAIALVIWFLRFVLR